MSGSLEHADFYVAVLTVIPIVLAGQFVLMRVMTQGVGRRDRITRVAEIGFHVGVGGLAVTMVLMALMVLAGFATDDSSTRFMLLVGAGTQVGLGVIGAVLEVLARNRHDAGPTP